MDLFAQKKILIRLVFILALLNIISIGVFLWKEFSHHHQTGEAPPREQKELSPVLKEKLNLTDVQAGQIKELRSTFFEKEKTLETAIREERDSMNAAMFNKTTDDELVKSLAKKIADNEYNMELLRFEQAKQFKVICTAAQMEKFEELVLEMRDYFKPEEPNKPK